jgi:indole-3-glycerol phosphate synthase
LAEVHARAKDARAVRDFVGALAVEPLPRLIAEVKHSRPRVGPICNGLFDPVAIARAYSANGADCISVLTDSEDFGGSLDHLAAVSASVDLPVLRKDFLVDPYQVWEGRAAGADAVLLIAEGLPGDELPRMYEAVKSAGMEALMEFFEIENLERVLALGAPLVGFNNRNLNTLTEDREAAIKMRARIPRERVRVFVAESCISAPEDVSRLQRAEVDAMLVGTCFMTAVDKGTAVAGLLAGRH